MRRVARRNRVISFCVARVRVRDALSSAVASSNFFAALAGITRTTQDLGSAGGNGSSSDRPSKSPLYTLSLVVLLRGDRTSLYSIGPQPRFWFGVNYSRFPTTSSFFFAGGSRRVRLHCPRRRASWCRFSASSRLR